MNTVSSTSVASFPGAVHMLVSPASALVAGDLIATVKEALGSHVKVYDDGSALDRDWLQDVAMRGFGFAALTQPTGDSWSRGATGARPAAQYVVLLAAGMDGDTSASGRPRPSVSYAPLDVGLERLLGAALAESGRTHSEMSSTPACSSKTLVASRPLGGIAPSALQRVRQHIEANLGERIEVDQLARLVGLSSCHFSRAFKQSMGVSPHRYLTSRRMLAAARLIETTDKEISEIALEVGFSHQSHFTRVFSAYFGKPPSRFRRQRR